MKNTNIAFFGEDHNSQIILERLIKYCTNSTKYNLTAIITTQPKPEEKNNSTEPNPVTKLAKTHKIKILYYSSKDNEMSKLINLLNKENTHLAVLTSFGHILPTKLLNAFSLGIINIHPSLLPQYRGATPVQHAIALGDTTTGVTLFTLDEDIDKGITLAQENYSITDSDTYPTLSKKLFSLGADLLEQVLDNNLSPLELEKPPSQKLIFTRVFKRNDGFIEWEAILALLDNENTIFTTNPLLNKYLVKNSTYSGALKSLIRALNPWPGVWTDASIKKGSLRIKFVSTKPELMVHLAGKPNPITWKEFNKYYLENIKQ